MSLSMVSRSYLTVPGEGDSKGWLELTVHVKCNKGKGIGVSERARAVLSGEHECLFSGVCDADSSRGALH